MLLRVRDFGKAHQELFPESLSGQKALAAVTRAIEEIETLTTERLIAARQTQRDQAARRGVIVDRMRTIARTSTRVMGPSGATMRLRMPRQVSDVTIVAEARMYLALAEEHHDQFVSLGLPDGCLTDLREALDAFEGAMADRRLGRAGVARAQTGIRAALAMGSDAAHTLDLVVRNAAGHDAGLIAAWERDLRIVGWKRRLDPGTVPVAPAAAAPDSASSAPQAAAPEATPAGETAILRKVS
jgi:hypothetical protein